MYNNKQNLNDWKFYKINENIVNPTFELYEIFNDGRAVLETLDKFINWF